MLVDVALRHDLHGELPFREIALLDRLEQIALMGLAVVGDLLGRLGVGPVLDALHGLEVEFDPVPLVLGVDERVGMRAEAVDIAIALRQAAVRHQDGDLVQALRRQRPEIPHRGRRPHVGSRVPLLGVDEVRELQRVAHEEYRRIVADHVPVAFLGVEAQREAAHVALCVGGAALAGDRREAQESFGRFALLQHLGLRVLRDVVSDGQRAIGARALGVLAAFGNALAVLVGKLLEQKEVLHQHRAARARRDAVLVVGNRHAGDGGEGGAFGHGLLLCCETSSIPATRPPCGSATHAFAMSPICEKAGSPKPINSFRSNFRSIAAIGPVLRSNAQEHLALACPKCGRVGHYSLPRLARERGREGELTD